MAHDDAALVRAAQANREQFAELYKKYYQKIFNYFWYRVAHDEAVAEDLTQDTFVRAYQALPRYTVTDRPYIAYLLTIAHNLLVNYYRTSRPISLEANNIDVPEEVWSEWERQDDVRALWRAIQDLSATEQDILYLRYRQGRPVKEVASIVGKSDNAVKLTLSRARKKLKQHPQLTDSVNTFRDRERRVRPGRYKRATGSSYNVSPQPSDHWQNLG